MAYDQYSQYQAHSAPQYTQHAASGQAQNFQSPSVYDQGVAYGDLGGYGADAYGYGGNEYQGGDGYGNNFNTYGQPNQVPGHDYGHGGGAYDPAGGANGHGQRPRPREPSGQRGYGQPPPNWRGPPNGPPMKQNPQRMRENGSERRAPPNDRNHYEPRDKHRQHPSNTRPQQAPGPGRGPPHPAYGNGRGPNPRPDNYSRPTVQNWSQPLPKPTQIDHHKARMDGSYATPQSPVRAGFGPTPRSATMPVSMKVESNSTPLQSDPAPLDQWAEPGAIAGYYGPESGGYISQGPDVQNRSLSGQHERHESLGDFLDSYYDTPTDAEAYAAYPPRPIAEEEMPNFDQNTSGNSSHKRGMTIDAHLQPSKVNTEVPPPLPHIAADGPPGNFGNLPYRSRSQPDLQARGQRPPNGRTGDGVFEMVGDVPSVPPLPRNVQTAPPQPGIRSASGPAHPPYGPNAMSNGRNPIPRPNGYPDQNLNYNQSHPSRRPEQYPGPYNNGPPTDDRRPSTSSNTRPGGYSATPPPPRAISDRSLKSENPDALPEHPTPVRPGLTPGNDALDPTQKPSPVRQYGGKPPSVKLDPNQKTAVDDKRGDAPPVTHEELERLRQIVRANPADSKTQLLLAKKMAEAANVLADEDGKADTKTRSRNRERYILDSLKIVKKLVGQGDPDASFYLADCYGQGLLGLEADPKEAFTLYQSAAKAGHAQAAFRTAVCCEIGQEDGGGTRKDPIKAVQWYKRAASLGDCAAMYKMGVILLKGLLGQQKVPREAVTWLKRSAERADQENPHALHELALLYENPGGNDSIIKDEQYAKQLFMQAAQLGYKFSQFRLGCAFEYGFMGFPIDSRQSIVWYSRAAVQEEHQSELALSGWYLTGSEGVLQQNDTEAYLWARKSAQSGLPKAEYAMGYFTEVGIGCPSSLEEAKRWYLRAAAQNFPKARERLEELRKGGAKVQKSRERLSRSNKQQEAECVVM